MMKQENEKFCHECGAVINIKAEICPKCGVRQPPLPNENKPIIPQKENKWLATLLFCWFLGVFGIHRFYTGHVGIGVIQLLTFGGCGIWYIVDLVLLITGSYKDSEGNVLKNTW